jgi:DeoR/GlpR family transcriptional regulator of sugar metabolism
VSEAGVTVADLAESALKAAVVAQAQQAIVPADYSKVGVADFVKVCELDAIDAIVTDRRTDYLEALCRTHGVELVSAGEEIRKSLLP